MHDIGPVGHDPLGRIEPTNSTPRREPGRDVSPRIRREQDEVEVSRMAVYLRKLREIPDVREDLVQRVRDAIARGEYDTPERLERAIDGMIAESDLPA